MLCFAVDVVTIAQGEIKLKSALDDILKSNYKIKFDKKKVKYVCSKYFENIHIKTDDSALKQVLKFKYPGSISTGDGKIEEDIIQRIKEAKVILIVAPCIS